MPSSRILRLVGILCPLILAALVASRQEEAFVTVHVTVVDSDSGEPIPHRVRIFDAKKRTWPPEGHVDISQSILTLEQGIEYEPDVVLGKKIWAMIEPGTFSARLPAKKLRIRVARGPEYARLDEPLDLRALGGQSVERQYVLQREIDMQELGWMSADTHVHNLSPSGALRQMEVEDLDYVNLMLIGGDHYLYKHGFLTGAPVELPSADRIVYVSQELRDHNQGHMTILGLREPIQPLRESQGKDLYVTKTSPNEPLNWEVTDQAHAQGALAFHAHFLRWPGHGSAVSAGLDKLDGVEWLQPDIVLADGRTRQFIQVAGFPLTSGGPIWYAMLNCGARLPLIGGSDKMGNNRALGHTARTYVRVPTWDHEGFMAGVAAGATFVTNGPLLQLVANGQPIGSSLAFEGEGPFKVRVDARSLSLDNIAYFEIIQDGEIAHRVMVEPGTTHVQATCELEFERSGWLAARAGGLRFENDGVNAAAHTSPIYVEVNGTQPAERRSARYLIARVEAAIVWAREEGIWSSPAYREKAIESFEAAREFYRRALERAGP